MSIQREGESVDSFITDLYILAEFCIFGELHDELIRDRIVVGISDKNLERLQLESDLTLSKAITTVRQKVVKKQQTLMNFKAFSAQQSVDARYSAKQRIPSRGKSTNTESKYSKISLFFIYTSKSYKMQENKHKIHERYRWEYAMPYQPCDLHI